jgi:hypothetical protein
MPTHNRTLEYLSIYRQFSDGSSVVAQLLRGLRVESSVGANVVIGLAAGAGENQEPDFPAGLATTFDTVGPITISRIGDAYAAPAQTFRNDACHDTPYPRINVVPKSLNHHIRHGG